MKTVRKKDLLHCLRILSPDVSSRRRRRRQPEPRCGVHAWCATCRATRWRHCRARSSPRTRARTEDSRSSRRCRSSLPHPRVCLPPPPVMSPPPTPGMSLPHPWVYPSPTPGYVSPNPRVCLPPPPGTPLPTPGNHPSPPSGICLPHPRVCPCPIPWESPFPTLKYR